MVKQYIREDVEESPNNIIDEEQPKKWQPKGKTIKSKKPSGAARQLFDAPILSSRPRNVYKERITDTDGKSGWFDWWTTEDSQVIGRDEIVKVNVMQQKETIIGYDFLIPHSEESKKKLLKDAYGKTQFYIKDGIDTQFIADPEKDW